MTSTNGFLGGFGEQDLAGRVAGLDQATDGTRLGPFAEENDILFISGPAASDAITGLNSHTFRSGRQSQPLRW